MALVKQTRKLNIENKSNDEFKSLPSNSSSFASSNTESSASSTSTIGMKQLRTKEQIEDNERRQRENVESAKTPSIPSLPSLEFSNDESQTSTKKNNSSSNFETSSEQSNFPSSASKIGFTKPKKTINNKKLVTKKVKRIAPKRTNLKTKEPNYNSNTEWSNTNSSSNISQSDSVLVTNNHTPNSRLFQIKNNKNNVSPFVSETFSLTPSDDSDDFKGSVASSAYLPSSDLSFVSNTSSNTSTSSRSFVPLQSNSSRLVTNMTNNSRARVPLMNNVSTSSVKSLKKVNNTLSSSRKSNKSETLLEDFKTSMISNEKIQNITLMSIILYTLIDKQLDYISGGKLNTSDPVEFQKQVKEVFIEIAKKPLKFEKFLVSVATDENQVYVNHNLGIRKSIGYNNYINYYNANSSQIIERKIITVLVNLIGEYTDCFVDLNDKKEIVKSIRQGIGRFLYRFSEFEYAFDAIHSDCSYASSIQQCQETIGCKHYSGPKRTGCRKVSKINSTYFNLDLHKEIKNISESDCIEFHRTISNIANLLPDEINRISLSYHNKNDETSKIIIGAYNQYLNRLMHVNDKLHNTSISMNITGGSSTKDVKLITNDELLNLFD